MVQVTDDFNRANATGNTALGANWEQYGHASNTPGINNNAVYNPSTVTVIARHATLPETASMFSQWTWRDIDPGVSVFAGPAVLVPPLGNSSTTTGSCFYLVVSGVNQTALTIRRKNANVTSNSTLGSSVTLSSGTVVAGTILRLEYDSSSGDLIGYIDGVEQIRRNPVSLSLPLEETGVTRGVGIVIGGTATLSRYDDFSGGDLGSGSTSVEKTASDTLSVTATEKSTTVYRGQGEIITITEDISVNTVGTTTKTVDESVTLEDEESSVEYGNLTDTITFTEDMIVTPGGGQTNVSKTASDTLTAILSENTPTYDAGVGYDSPTIGYDGILRIDIANKVASDTLSASATDATISLVVTGTIVKSASDTLSASVTESTSRNITTFKTGTDTLSASLTEGTPIIEPSEVIIEPQTINATFDFLTGRQNFFPVLTSGATSEWDSTIGNPAGSLKITRAGKNLVPSQSYWQWTGTWNALGVPFGAVVTHVSLGGAWNRVSEFTNGTGVQVGPYDIRNSAGELLATLWSGRTASGTDAGTVIAEQPEFPIPEISGNYNDEIKLRLYNTIGTLNPANPSVSINDDQISLNITYMPSTEFYTDDTLSPTVTETSTITVTTNDVFASDSLAATVTDIADTPVVSGLGQSASDTLNVSVSDTGVPLTTRSNVSSSDSLSVMLSDSSIPTVRIGPASDSLSVSLTDSSRRVVGGNVFPAYDSDTVYNDVSEYNGGGTIQKAGADTLSAGITEGIFFATIARIASDLLRPSVTEQSGFGPISIITNDAVVVMLNDASAGFKVGYFSTDSLNATITEQSEFAPIAISASDTLSARLSAEIRSFATITVSASDSLVATVSEGFAGKRFFSAADTLTVQQTDRIQKFVNGNLVLTSSDSLNVQVAEGISFAPISRTSSDTLSVSTSETPAVTARRTTSDSLTAVVADATVRTAIVHTASDALVAALTDAGAKIQTTKFPTYIWDEQGEMKLVQIFLYNGSSWYEPEMYLWNGVDWV